MSVSLSVSLSLSVWALVHVRPVAHNCMARRECGAPGSRRGQAVEENVATLEVLGIKTPRRSRFSWSSLKSRLELVSPIWWSQRAEGEVQRGVTSVRDEVKIG